MTTFVEKSDVVKSDETSQNDGAIFSRMPSTPTTRSATTL